MRHLISGSQSDLLYLYQMLNRVMHGDTISDARRDIKKSRIYEEEERLANSMTGITPIQTSHPSTRSSSPVSIQSSAMSYSSTEDRLEIPATGSSASPSPSITDSALPFDASFGFDDRGNDGGMQWAMFDDPAPAIESVESAVSNEPAVMNGWGTNEISPAANESPPSSSMTLSRAAKTI